MSLTVELFLMQDILANNSGTSNAIFIVLCLKLCYVMPSSSARCAQFPRAQDKVHYYIKLKDLRDQLKGIAPNTEVQEVQYTFDLQLAQGMVFIFLVLYKGVV